MLYDNVNQMNNIDGLINYTTKTCTIMFIGLFLSMITALFTYRTGIWELTMYLPIFIILFLIQIGLILLFYYKLNDISYNTAMACFIIFSLIDGMTLAIIFAAYTLTTIYFAFGSAALLFGVMALYGYTTKRDMTQYRNLLLSGLVTIIIISLIGLFINLGPLNIIISCAMVIIFLGLTAYDSQEIKRNYEKCQSEDLLNKLAISSAWQLYLDFINLFLALLRILGSRD